MEYLVRKTSSKVAHLWDNGDTYCRMYSTNGLAKKKYVVVQNRNTKEICQMCNSVFEEYSGYKYK
jgi:hypothetical protein